jgi:Amt family ammonium transporter
MTRLPLFLLRIFFALLLLTALPLAAQTDAPTPSNVAPVAVTAPVDTNMAVPGATAQAAAAETNAAPVTPASGPQFSAAPAVAPSRPLPPDWSILGHLLAFGAVAGLVAWFCGLTRARHCGHTCTLLLAGVMFALVGYWVGGFAMQSGGMGDAHAALPSPPRAAAVSGLDHELGFMAGGHHWGLMGSAGFFLSSDADSRAPMTALFFGQMVFLALAVTAALGAALERARILAVAIISFLAGALLFPLVANWVWGGGWLAALGGEFGLGHGVVDLAGAGVNHLAAGTLALVLAIQLGPRFGRFGRRPAPIPGHNLPLAILGSLVVLVGLATLNAMSYPGAPGGDSPAGLAAANTLLGAAGGLVAAFMFVLYHGRKLDPVAICRGMLGGAVSATAAGALVESWAAVVTGAIAGVVVQWTMRLLERRQIDDPVGVVAVHGAGGAWGLVALGLFANDANGGAINGVSGPVRGLLTAHDGRQLLAQIIGAVVIAGVVFALGSVFVILTNKIVGIRVGLDDEQAGLDEPKLGVLGYQGDAVVEVDGEAGEK